MSNASKLLINEPALQVLPSLACLVGLNEAILLQQIHYWLYNAEKSKRLGVYKYNRWWIFNTLDEWRASNFPFWSTKTIQRTLDSLRDKRVVLTARLSTNNLDQTLYYSIDYAHLDLLFEQVAASKQSLPPFGQDVQMDVPFGQDDQMHLDNLTESIWTSCPTVNKESETTSETTHREQFAPLEVWKMVKGQLELEMRKGDFMAYVKPIENLKFQDGHFILGVPNSTARAWCDSRIARKASRLASAIAGQEITVEFVDVPL